MNPGLQVAFVFVFVFMLVLSAGAAADLRQVAYYLRLARDSHQQWAAYYRAFPDEKERLVKQAVCTGDEAFNDKWAARYEALLKSLEGR